MVENKVSADNNLQGFANAYKNMHSLVDQARAWKEKGELSLEIACFYNVIKYVEQYRDFLIKKSENKN